MKPRVIIQIALPVGWLLLLILWPKPTNVPTSEDGLRHNSTGEGLYKAATTKANFGLLGVNFYESHEGKRRWNIQSEYAELHRKENYAFLQIVQTKFFAEKTGNIVYTQSDTGRAWTDKSLVELEGNVSITSRRGYRFTMDKLLYDGKSHEFTSEDTINMAGPDAKHPVMFLRGVGLSADIDREHFIIKKNVRGRKALKEGNWLRITSKVGEFFTDENRAVFIGSVHSVLPSAIIDSDIFEMTIAEDKDELHAKGNVILRNKDRIGKAQNAYLEVGGNEIILEGKAQIDSADNHLKGRRIKLFTDDDRIEVEEAEGTGVEGLKP
jgi:LPS export ABC transporter protein LptC